MTYRNLFFFILGPIILGIILANLTWPIAHRLPLPFFMPGPFSESYWIVYIIDLLLWAIIMLAIVQSVRFFRKLRREKNMTYRNLFFFILGPIILGIILSNLTWFWEVIQLPGGFRGMPFHFFVEVTECVLPPGAKECPGSHFSPLGYILNLFFWVAVTLAIARFISFLKNKLRK